jgi:predicted transcriptional regulator
MKNRPLPTDVELEILKAVWLRGQATVREIYLDLLKQRKIAYTTVLTMMGVLERKGHLKKEPGERAYVYRPAESQSKVIARMVNDFVHRVFDGSTKPLLVHLVEETEVSAKELDEIETLVRERRRKR